MKNIKWGLTAAIAAIVISAGLGLISGVSIAHVFLRAFVFAAVFFAFGFGLHFMISSFFPELLYLDEEPSAQGANDQPGSRINITLDNTGEYAVPELYKTPGNSQELGNIEDLISGVFRTRSESPGIDRKSEESYNIDSAVPSVPDHENFNFQDTLTFETPKVDTAGAEKPRAEKPVFTPSFGDDAGLGGLPDLELLSMAFSGGGELRPSPPVTAAGGFGGVSVPEQAQEEFEPTQPTRHVASKPPAQLSGDYNPKDLAKGISTILSKDKK